ncbi:MAG: hypothetical protein RR128_07900 [Clostridium sp.]
MKMQRIDEIFKKYSGNKLDFGKMTICENCEEGIPFVSRTSKNNGVVGYVEMLNNINPYPEGAITVSLGEPVKNFV